MSNNESRLGKGLSALLGEAASADRLRKPVGYVNKEVVGARPAQETADVLRIPVDMVEANPYQPRMSFDQEALEELASSIKTLGLIQPITVRKLSDTRYQIISGERRFKACSMAGMTMIPAYVRTASNQGMLEMAIVENIQRENLDPIETAISFQRLIDECQLTQENMAERVGKKRSTIANSLRLLNLPVKIQHDIKVGLLSTGHAKVLLGVEDAELQEHLCDLVIKDGLSVRQLEEIVRHHLRPARRKTVIKDQQLTDDCYRVLEHMGKYFSNSISMKRASSGKGTLTVHFNSDEEIANFLQALEDNRG